MRPAPQGQAGKGIDVHRWAALIHEGLLIAAGTDAFNAVGGVLLVLLEQHQPHHPPVDSLFAATHGQPVCRGCDRAQLTPTREPAWPCHTYRTIAEHLGHVFAEVPPSAAAALIHLDDRRSLADRNTVDARHRAPRPVDTRTDTAPDMRLVRSEEGVP